MGVSSGVVVMGSTGDTGISISPLSAVIKRRRARSRNAASGGAEDAEDVVDVVDVVDVSVVRMISPVAVSLMCQANVRSC